jgi:hypothetical protein
MLRRVRAEWPPDRVSFGAVTRSLVAMDEDLSSLSNVTSDISCLSTSQS